MADNDRSVLYEVVDTHALLTLHRAKALNAIDPRMLAELGEAIGAAEADDRVAALVLTGAGERAFSSGMDLRAFREREAADAPSSARGRRRRAGASHPLALARKPIIAAVNGLAYGGGLELVLLCDIVIAAEHATFAAAEVSRGVIPGNGATQRLPRRIGYGPAIEMLMTGLPVDARKALRLGLVNDVVPATSLLDAAARAATAIAANAPVAVRTAKEAARRGLEMTLDQGLELEGDLLAMVQSTDDAKEGVLAFLEKRKPRWSNC